MATTVNGFYSSPNGRPLEAPAAISYTARGMGSLSVSVAGRYRIDMPFHPIGQLAGVVRAHARTKPNETVELSAEAQGYYTAGQHRMRPGKVTLWLSSLRRFESLTLEYAGQGQISVPYAAVEALVRAERRNLI